MIEQMDGFSHSHPKRTYYIFAETFIEGQCGSGHITGCVRNPEHIKIPLDLSIFSRGAMNCVKNNIWTDDLSTRWKSEIIFIYRDHLIFLQAIPMFSPDLDKERLKLFLV